MPKRLSKEKFVERAKKAHNNYYDYSLVKYEGAHKQIFILCPIHGKFKQTPAVHLSGNSGKPSGCPSCGKEKRIKIKTKTTERFIADAKKIHRNKYNYSKVNYTGCYNKVEVVCPLHSGFFQKANLHLLGQGCRKCGYKQVSNKNRMSKEVFLKRVKGLFNNKYNYIDLENFKLKNKITIECPEHGLFKIVAQNHLYIKSECPSCLKLRSKGEMKIIEILNKFNIRFEEQKIFKGCTRGLKSYLRFDFYLPNYNSCIEYDGSQHYNKTLKPTWGKQDILKTQKSFLETKQRDAFKDNYCLQNNVKLLRIPFYRFKQIEREIKNLLNLEL